MESNLQTNLLFFILISEWTSLNVARPSC